MTAGRFDNPPRPKTPLAPTGEPASVRAGFREIPKIQYKRPIQGGQTIANIPVLSTSGFALCVSLQLHCETLGGRAQNRPPKGRHRLRPGGGGEYDE
jgi:hypothetical protein